jgi:hypothetical protein
MKRTGNHIRTVSKPAGAVTSLIIVLETIFDTLAILAVRQRQAAWKTPFGQYIPSLPGDPTIQFPVDDDGGGGGGGLL